MSLEQYILGNVIGKGSYGEVTLARHKKDKRQPIHKFSVDYHSNYVIKKIDLHNASPKERLFAQQEVEILSKLRHPNIVSYKESFQTTDGGLSIVMGYCESGDLYTKLKNQAKLREFLDETQIVEWFVQIAMALQYMHDRHILHRDLKTQNIFLTKSKIIKLGDLGIARVLDSNVDMATTMIGTPYYMSPELFSNKPYNHKSDVWALGCCVYEMATLKHAFNAKDMNSLVYKILKGKIPEMPKHYTTELQQIIKSMLNYDPTQRPSASRILRHQFIKKHIAIFLEGTKNRKKSRDEKPRKITPKVPSDSGYSESNNADVIATASKIELDILDINEKAEAYVEKNKKLSPDISVEKKQVVRKQSSKKEKMTKKDQISSSIESCNSEKHVHINGDKHSEPSRVRKIARERMRAKARLKKEELMNNNECVEIQQCDREQCTPSDEKSSPKQFKDSPRKRRQELSKRPLPTCPVTNSNEQKQPRLPPPRFKNDLEQNGSDQKQDGDKSGMPQVSAGVPNLAARKKRRQRQKERESQMSPPSFQKRGSDSSISVLSFQSHTPRSHEEIIKDHLQRHSTFDETESVDGPKSNQSERLTGCNSESENVDFEDIREKKNSDVSNLIVTLQATLKMDPETKNCTSPEESIDMDQCDFPPSASGRLKDRIKRLRSECAAGLGENIVHDAYRIIDTHKEDDVEPVLVQLMGKQKFDDYGAKIWQLKFCEEFKL